VLHQERVSIEVQQDAVRAVVRRRITSETRSIEVTVQREVLEVEYLPASQDLTRAPEGSHAPMVMVLSEEVPVVQLVTRPYEQVTVDVLTVDEQQDVTTTVAGERADVASDSAYGTQSSTPATPGPGSVSTTGPTQALDR